MDIPLYENISLKVNKLFKANFLLPKSFYLATSLKNYNLVNYDAPNGFCYTILEDLIKQFLNCIVPVRVNLKYITRCSVNRVI